MDRKKYVVIMAAGSGVRLGADKPKQFLEICGKMILRMTIEKFVAACPDIVVVTVLPESYIDYWKEYCYRSGFIYPQLLVKGGFTRFHSVRNALAKIPDGALVAVHDGVRPLVSEALIRAAFEKASATGSAIPVMPCTDTLKALQKKTREDGSLSYKLVPDMSVDRSVLYGAQTPQIFNSEMLKCAYGQAYDTTFTDDASVVERQGKSLSYIAGERLNIKITTLEDLTLAEAILKSRED